MEKKSPFLFTKKDASFCFLTILLLLLGLNGSAAPEDEDDAIGGGGGRSFSHLLRNSERWRERSSGQLWRLEA